jgi:transcriptional regulator with PAS, ATPase and Fis domain
MDKIPDVLIQILNNIEEASAIFSQDHRVIYSNDSFKIFFQFSPDPHNKRQCQALKQLSLKHRDGHMISPLQEINKPGGGEKLPASVYFVNTSRAGESYFLVLVKTTNRQKDSPARPAQRITNPYADSGIVRSEKLLAEFRELVGDDIKFKRALLIAQKAAKSDLPVLIIGESGTGKELLARAIHRTSRRKSRNLVDVNCAAIPDTLIESELFGYEKGAFTGARAEGRPGYFDEAHEGTILMDEIGDASLQTQSKLLRVLEDGCFKRVGGNRNVRVDVRLISSTNQDLSALILDKTFREDLFYRLNTFTIYIPALRERHGDIPLLVDHFLISNIEREKKNFKFLPSSMDILQSYHWPGNVRELKGVVNYAVNMASGAIISPSSLPNFLFSPASVSQKQEREIAPSFVPTQTFNMPEVIQHVERDLIKEALAHSSNRTEAIKKLGISRRTFYAKMRQYELDSLPDDIHETAE